MKYFKSGAIPDFEYHMAIKKPIPIRCIQINESFEVETLENKRMKGNPGDYLMIGINGEMYPCNEKIFDQTYQIIS